MSNVAASPGANAVNYRVQRNDSVDKIAARYGVSREELVALNPELRRNIDLIHVGQTLKLPSRGSSSNTSPALPEPASYTVRRGDNLSVIARRVGVSVADLRRLNASSIGRNDLIYSNQRLLLRDAAPTSPEQRADATPGVVTPAEAPAVAADAEPPAQATDAAAQSVAAAQTPDVPADVPADTAERTSAIDVAAAPAASPTAVTPTDAAPPVAATPDIATPDAATAEAAGPQPPVEAAETALAATPGDAAVSAAADSTAAAVAAPAEPVATDTALTESAATPTATAIETLPQVTNPDAQTTMDKESFVNLLNGGRLNVTSLTNDAEIRRLAGDVAIEGLQKHGAGAAARLSSTMLRSLGLSDDVMKRFRREGVSALSPEQQGTLRNALAEQSLGVLRRIGGTSGIIESRRANDVFDWIDRFDTNGDGDTIAMAGVSAEGQPAQLTPAGRVMARVVATQTAPVTFTERDFVAGFRNGVIDSQRLLNDAEARSILQDAGILDSLVQSVSSGQNVQLTVSQLRALYRSVDKRDNNGSADSFIVRNGGNLSRDVAVPFSVPASTQAPTDAGRIVAALNSVFKTNHQYNEGEERPSVYDVPPPVGNEGPDLLRDVGPRLSERPSVDSTAFREFMRDARIDLNGISQPEIDALARTGVTIDKLRALAGEDGTIGGPNADMAKLYEMLRASNRPVTRTIKPFVDGNAFMRTNAGLALQLLERHTVRHTLLTQEELNTQLRGSKIDLTALDRPVQGMTQTGRALLTSSGFDVAALETWVKANPARAQGRIAAPQLFNMLRASGAYTDPRPGTLSVAVSHYDDTGSYDQATRAGAILTALQASGVLRVDEQQPRVYETANGAMLAPAGTTSVSIPFTHYVMRGRVDCLLRVRDTIRSGGNGRSISMSGEGSWLATAGDRQGRITASRDDLVAARKYIDAMLDNGQMVGVGVARLNGANLNFDDITDHYVTVVGRGVDEQGRLYYTYADSAKVYNGRFYVDPTTDLLYAPRDAAYTVAGGGYQVSHIRAFSGGGWAGEYKRITGRAPRSA